MKQKSILILLTMLFPLLNCTAPDRGNSDSSELYEGFVNPPADSRAFMRWWWNGNQVEKDELLRQLDVMKDVGIGGIEINPIAMSVWSADIGKRPLIWLSKEWNEILVMTAREAEKRGMITDIIVGSGWPFGGEFLKLDETIQRIINHRIPVSGGDIIQEDTESLFMKLRETLHERLLRHLPGQYKLYFVRLVPNNMKDFSEIIDLTDIFNENDRLDYVVPDGEFELIYGIHETSVREVMHGAPGAAGPVMDHYRKEITLAYLNRLIKISEDTGVKLSEIIRALFCDSIELAGANWTDNLEEKFYQTFGYRLEPYLPFVLYDPYRGYTKFEFNDELLDKIRRARYDYNEFLVLLFLDNFTRVFHEFCRDHGLLSRYQAYGTPFLMGMMEGNMIADIPESNNWVYNSPMQNEHWEWAEQSQGYMVWNLYASSGGHLNGKKIISNEAMTNTLGVFKLSLDEVKQHDDMNFITGMNHAVLHGYNYSPAEAGFPGWIRYGAYFSEMNTWWPYFHKWVDYNARLSFILQNSQPVKKIAIMGPQSDVWSNYGLTRTPFHNTPWYWHRLWESISQAGNSCDYITETIVQQGDMSNGKLSYGPMTYEVILLPGVTSVDPETAFALKSYVKNGGKLVIIDGAPKRTASMMDAGEGDATVQKIFPELLKSYPDRVSFFDKPESEAELLPWTVKLLMDIGIKNDVDIDTPDRSVYQIRKKAGDLDIYFFTNSNRLRTMTFNAVFPTGKKIPWVWNSETGSRSVYPYGESRNSFTIELQPLQSLLLVFEPKLEGEQDESLKINPGIEVLNFRGPWQAEFEHMNGKKFTRRFEHLFDFGTSNDRELNSFAGTVIYTGVLNSNGSGKWLELGKVNKGVLELYLNGKKAGLSWYGRPIFNVQGLLVNGENLVEIKYTTVLSNYTMSLNNNPAAEYWTQNFSKIPVGLEGELKIFH